MTDHKTGTREQWLAARLELLQAEKEKARSAPDTVVTGKNGKLLRRGKEVELDADGNWKPKAE